MQVIQLADDAMPALGLGTWKSSTGDVGAAIVEAIRIGYRHIDCSPIYGNEAEVGDAIASCIAEGLVERNALWVTSKLWCDRHAPEDVIPALESTLADLRLDYLDLYLVHWPVALKKGIPLPQTAADFISLDDLPLSTTWEGMEAARNQSLCRHIGVSNCSITKLQQLRENAIVQPEVNQVELHPYLQQPALLDYCSRNDIVVTAYSPLGSPDRNPRLKPADEPTLLQDRVINEIAESNGISAAQVLLAWALQRGTTVLAKSVTASRIAENLAAEKLTLSSSDLRRIAELDRHRRYVSGSFWELDGGPYTVAALWDEPR